MENKSSSYLAVRGNNEALHYGLSIVNGSSQANSTFFGMVNDTVPINMQFNDGHILAISVYSILLIFSGVGNISVLVTILRLRMKSRLNRVNLFLLHLAIADLIVTFLLMPLEIGWATTVSWRAGDLACRILSFVRVFGLYLSGFLLVCISLDRYFAVLKPLTLPEANQRGRYMLGSAWLGSAICSFPQMLIFHVERHPQHPWFEQCVTFGSFPTHAYELAYFAFGFIFLYGFPLAMIISCYCCILCEICKINNLNRVGENLRRSSMGALNRAKIRTLKMTIVIVSTFFLCWTPYNVISLWYHIDRTSASSVDVRVQKCLFLFAVANSCVNPVVYGLFHIRRRPTENSKGCSNNGRLQRIDKESFKFRVRWKPRTECLCAGASGSSQINSSTGGQPGRLHQRPLYELDYYRNGRASSPNPRSNTTITRLNNRLSPNDGRPMGNGTARGSRNGPKKSHRVKFVNLQNLEHGKNHTGAFYLNQNHLSCGRHQSGEPNDMTRRERSPGRNRIRSSSSESSSAENHNSFSNNNNNNSSDRRAQSLPDTHRSVRSNSHEGTDSPGKLTIEGDRCCYVHSEWNIASASALRTGSIFERRL